VLIGSSNAIPRRFKFAQTTVPNASICPQVRMTSLPTPGSLGPLIRAPVSETSSKSILLRPLMASSDPDSRIDARGSALRPRS